MDFLRRVIKFIGEILDFLDKHSGTIAIVLIPPAIALGLGGVLASLPLLGWIGIGVGFGALVFGVYSLVTHVTHQ